MGRPSFPRQPTAVAGDAHAPPPLARPSPSGVERRKRRGDCQCRGVGNGARPWIHGEEGGEGEGGVAVAETVRHWRKRRQSGGAGGGGAWVPTPTGGSWDPSTCTRFGHG